MAGNTINVQGSYIDVHDNEHVYLSVDKAEVSVKDKTFLNESSVTAKQMPSGKNGNGSLPEALQTEEAQEMWEDLRDAGFIVPDGYALARGISANQATYIADRMATHLGIAKKWKVFGELWGIKNMAQLAGSWQQTGKLPPRSREIDKLI